MRPTVTRLTEDELHEAEAVVRRLAGKPRSLSFYVDFALANYREPVCQKSLKEAAAEYVAAKKHEFEQDLISDSYFVRLEGEMERVPKRVAYFEFHRASRKTYNNRRGTMTGFLKFALQREWSRRGGGILSHQAEAFECIGREAAGSSGVACSGLIVARG